MRNEKLLFAGVAVITMFIMLDLYLRHLVTSLPRGTTLPLTMSTDSNPCEVSPYCSINMKSLILDPPNFYIYHPLSIFLVRKLDLANSYQFISANALSITHVSIAFLASRLISRDSIFERRIGVLIFELRNSLDALDGAVARARSLSSNHHPQKRTNEDLSFNSHPELFKNDGKEKFNHNSTTTEEKETLSNQDSLSYSGFYIDGVTDAIGCFFLYFACFTYLRKHSLLSYRPLPVVILSKSNVSLIDSDDKEDSKTWSYKIISGNGSNAYILRRIIRSVKQSGITAVSFGFQSLFGSFAWNRYLENYSKLLENNEDLPKDSPIRYVKSGFLHSPMMWLVIFTWRYVNPHACLEIALMAIFLDKMRELLHFFRYFGFFILFLAICFTEMQLYEVRNAINVRN